MRTCHTVVIKRRKGRALPQSQWVVQKRCKRRKSSGGRKRTCRGPKGRFKRCR